MSGKGWFWRSWFGLFLRWIIYIPLCLVLLHCIDFVFVLGTIWLFNGSIKLFIILGVLVGAIFTVIPLMVMLYYWSIVLANSVICPVPRVGVIIFATIYAIVSFKPIIKTFDLSLGAGVYVPAILFRLIFLVTAAVSFFAVYAADMEKRAREQFVVEDDNFLLESNRA